MGVGMDNSACMEALMEAGEERRDGGTDGQTDRQPGGSGGPWGGCGRRLVPTLRLFPRGRTFLRCSMRRQRCPQGRKRETE